MASKAVTLPRSLTDPTQWDELIEKYKSFRLSSLQLSPKSFSSTYAREVELPKSKWEARLSNPLAINTVVVSNPDTGSASDDLSLVLHSSWLASLVVCGPFHADTAAKKWEEQQGFDPGCLNFGPPKPGIEWAYVLNAIYVPPSQRRKGLANRLIENAKQLVAGIHSESKVMLVLVVNFESVAAMKCYKKSGFELVHDYWFNDRDSTKGHAAVMRLDVNVNRSSN
ncbi:gnat family [Fusarium sporotrichioides]|uniref:Gnat family n=1 Tax=Fusarium sporotrichioides TaxID=5514 RepID=A0A395S5I8_FUSSP|nr:gnat family [Fusarium sporotrichioides]